MRRIGRVVAAFSPQECRNFLRHAVRSNIRSYAPQNAQSVGPSGAGTGLGLRGRCHKRRTPPDRRRSSLRDRLPKESRNWGRPVLSAFALRSILHCNNSEGPVRFRPTATDPDHEIDLIEEGLGLSWVEPFLAMIDGRPFAYIQAYDVHASPAPNTLTSRRAAGAWTPLSARLTWPRPRLGGVARFRPPVLRQGPSLRPDRSGSRQSRAVNAYRRAASPLSKNGRPNGGR
jgi:hypothetical protein